MAALTADGRIRWQRRKDVLWREALGSVVLLPASAKEPLTVSPPFSLLWEALRRPTTLEDMVGLLEAHELAEADPRDALATLVDALVEREAIRVVKAAS